MAVQIKEDVGTEFEDKMEDESFFSTDINFAWDKIISDELPQNMPLRVSTNSSVCGVHFQHIIDWFKGFLKSEDFACYEFEVKRDVFTMHLVGPSMDAVVFDKTVLDELNTQLELAGGTSKFTKATIGNQTKIPKKIYDHLKRIAEDPIVEIKMPKSNKDVLEEGGPSMSVLSRPTCDGTVGEFRMNVVGPMTDKIASDFAKAQIRSINTDNFKKRLETITSGVESLGKAFTTLQLIATALYQLGVWVKGVWLGSLELEIVSPNTDTTNRLMNKFSSLTQVFNDALSTSGYESEFFESVELLSFKQEHINEDTKQLLLKDSNALWKIKDSDTANSQILVSETETLMYQKKTVHRYDASQAPAKSTRSADNKSPQQGKPSKRKGSRSEGQKSASSKEPRLEGPQLPEFRYVFNGQREEPRRTRNESSAFNKRFDIGETLRDVPFLVDYYQHLLTTDSQKASKIYDQLRTLVIDKDKKKVEANVYEVKDLFKKCKGVEAILFVQLAADLHLIDHKGRETGVKVVACIKRLKKLAPTLDKNTKTPNQLLEIMHSLIEKMIPATIDKYPIADRRVDKATCYYYCGIAAQAISTFKSKEELAKAETYIGSKRNKNLKKILGKCILERAKLLKLELKYEEAIKRCTEAKKVFAKIGNTKYVEDCEKEIGELKSELKAK